MVLQQQREQGEASEVEGKWRRRRERHSHCVRKSAKSESVPRRDDDDDAQPCLRCHVLLFHLDDVWEEDFSRKKGRVWNSKISRRSKHKRRTSVQCRFLPDERERRRSRLKRRIFGYSVLWSTRSLELSTWRKSADSGPSTTNTKRHQRDDRSSKKVEQRLEVLTRK